METGNRYDGISSFNTFRPMYVGVNCKHKYGVHVVVTVDTRADQSARRLGIEA